jgi:Domain of unknown function (DUF5667)
MLRSASRSNKEFEEILSQCLELVESGQEPVDKVLARYPDLVDKLRPPLEAASWLLTMRPALDPRPGFVAASRKRMVKHFQAGDTTVLPPLPGSRWAGLAPLFQKKMVAQIAMLVTVTAILLLIGVYSFSFMLKNTVPGEPLYATKLAQERLTLALSFSKAGDTRWRIEFVQRRLVELEKLIVNGDTEHVNEAVMLYQQQLTEVVDEIEATSQDNRELASTLSLYLQRVISDPTDSLRVLLGSIATAENDEIIRILAMTDFELGQLDALGLFTLPAVKFTATATATATRTPTFTRTPRPTRTLTPTPTKTPRITATSTPTAKRSPTPTYTSTPKKNTPTYTPTTTPTPKDKIKPKPTNTHRPTQKPRPNDRD